MAEPTANFIQLERTARAYERLSRRFGRARTYRMVAPIVRRAIAPLRAEVRRLTPVKSGQLKQATRSSVRRSRYGGAYGRITWNRNRADPDPERGGIKTSEAEWGINRSGEPPKPMRTAWRRGGRAAYATLDRGLEQLLAREFSRAGLR